MMSLIDLDDDQRWVPTHVNVTVLRARGLRTKGKHGSRYLYTIIQVGKEKYTTGLVEKVEVPEWNEECSFELLPGILEDGGRDASPPGCADLVLTVMHRVLIGLDVFLGQAIIPLDKIFQEGTCPRDEWFKLNSKSGRKEKERGGLQVTVQFTRNNMTASMFDLTIKDKPRSVFGKLKDRVTGRKRGDVESSSAILPGRYAALSGSVGQPLGEPEQAEPEVAEEKKSKMKEFLKGKLRKSSDTVSCASLASEGSVFSVASDHPPPSLDLLSDPPSSPIYTTKVRLDAHYGDADLAKKVLTSQHTTKVLTHKRAFSDEASKIKTSFSRANLAMESLKGHTMTQSKSSVCINGSHVYDSEPSTPRSSAAHPCKLVLLEKCAPLSRSLQNLTKRSEDRGAFGEGRRWSFDKTKKEEEKDPLSSSSPAQTGSQGAQGATPASSSTSPDKGKKPRKTLFSAGRSDSDPNQGSSLSDRRLRGWFGSGESQNKPRLEFSPKVESSSDVPPPIPPRSPVPHLRSPPSTSPSSLFSSDDCSRTSPPLNPPLNSFPTNLQRNPFLEELLVEESQRSPPFSPSHPPFDRTPPPLTAGPARDPNANTRRERPRPAATQTPPPSQLTPGPLDPSGGLRSLPDCAGGDEDSFDAFASSRLNSPKAGPPQKQSGTSPLSSQGGGAFVFNDAQELQACDEEPPPLPPRRPLRTPVNDMCSDGWLHRGQELAVHKEAFLLSQTGVASRQRGKEGEHKGHDASPDSHTSSEASDGGGGGGGGGSTAAVRPSAEAASPALASEGKLQRFKYQPLEDNRDCLGGMLFEQDLYGRACRGSYSQANINAHHLSISAEDTKSKTTSVGRGSRMLLDSVLPVKDLLNLSLLPSKPSSKVLDVPGPQVKETESSPPEATPTSNVSFSMTLGDLNMNVSNSDFSLVDPESSSQAEVSVTPECRSDCGETAPELSLKASGEADTPQDAFTLKDTYITGMNSSFEVTTSMNKWSKSCQPYQCEPGSVAPQNQGSFPPAPDDAYGRFGDFKKTPVDFDANGNLQGKTGPGQTGLFPGVTSARIRPKGVSRQSSSSPNNRSSREDGEFQQLLSLVQSISGANEGPLSYQPVNSALSSILACKSQVNPQDQGPPDAGPPPASNLNAPKFSRVSFEDLHAQVAPRWKTKTQPEAPSGSASSAPAPTLHDPQDGAHPARPSGPSAEADSALSVPPPSSSSSSSTSTTDPQVDALPSLLPEETQPANNLPQLESRTHPVKPLTSSQSDKKEGRSVLEKLKSTINPGRSAQQVTAEPQKVQEASEDRAAQYQHLTNMELISLLLQQEMDMQKQQAASELQEAQLRKCEAELRKVKSQVRDLEDYIDNLLLRIMEQTPTLLQVRGRHK